MRRGILALPETGVLGITPPLTISPRQLAHALGVIKELL